MNVQRVAATVLVLGYLALGSGAVERWHNAQHAARDAQLIAAARQSGMPLGPLPFHTDYNCSFHSQLHLSGMAVAWVPLLICLRQPLMRDLHAVALKLTSKTLFAGSPEDPTSPS